MRKVREVLRLKHACGVSERVIARSVGVSRSTVAEYLRRAVVIGLAWPIPDALDDAALERRLFTPPGFHAGPTQPLLDWSRVHTELRRRGVRLLLLWEEYRAEHPDGYGGHRTSLAWLSEGTVPASQLPTTLTLGVLQAGRFAVVPVAGLLTNQWPLCSGIPGRSAAEYAA